MKGKEGVDWEWYNKSLGVRYQREIDPKPKLRGVGPAFMFVFWAALIGVVLGSIISKCNAAEIVELQPGQADTTVTCEDFLIKPAIAPCTTKVKGLFDYKQKRMLQFGRVADTVKYYTYPEYVTICDTVIVKAVGNNRTASPKPCTRKCGGK